MVDSIKSQGLPIFSQLDGQQKQTIGGLLKAIDPKIYNAFSGAVERFIIAFNNEKNHPSPQHLEELEDAAKILKDVFKVAKKAVLKILAKYLEMKELLIEVIVSLSDPHFPTAGHLEGAVFGGAIGDHFSHAKVSEEAQEIAVSASVNADAYVDGDCSKENLIESLNQLQGIIER